MKKTKNNLSWKFARSQSGRTIWYRMIFPPTSKALWSTYHRWFRAKWRILPVSLRSLLRAICSMAGIFHWALGTYMDELATRFITRGKHRDVTSEVRLKWIYKHCFPIDHSTGRAILCEWDSLTHGRALLKRSLYVSLVISVFEFNLILMFRIKGKEECSIL